MMPNTAEVIKGWDITDQEFQRIRTLMMEWAGLALGDNKKSLVVSRLSKRLRFYQVNSVGDYLDIVVKDASGKERQMIIDLITTNETFFFREPEHFEFLKDYVRNPKRVGQFLNIWCAASSTGEEPYSIAMTLYDKKCNDGWKLLATDINHAVLQTSKRGQYPLSAKEKIPTDYLCRFCRKGVRSQEGTLIIDPKLKRNIEFNYFNLNGAFLNMGPFDLVFIRNVMIYFNKETKAKLLNNIAKTMKPNGLMIVSHSESINGLCKYFKLVKPSIYRLSDEHR